MQQFKTTWYFAFGAPEKTSLCTQFCRQNNYVHFANPKIDDLSKNKDKHAIIQGSHELFKQIQKIKPQFSIILVGKTNNKEQRLLCQQYEKIGRLKKSPTYKYQQFRRKLFPNLIFVYGPVAKQTRAAAHTLANNIGYVYSDLAKDSNDYISYIDKSQNYVINGSFEDSKQIKILHQFFEIRVIHLKYNRVDLPDHSQFFDKEFNLVSFLKDKNYYIPVDATASQVKILDDIGAKLCPKIIYANPTTKQQSDYLQKYIQQTDGILLNFQHIQNINKKKNVPLLGDSHSKLLYLSSLFYKDLNRKQIVLSYYPWHLNQILALQNLNRKISLFVDLSDAEKYQYNKSFTTPTYFLESQKYTRPNQHNSLKNQLQQKITYWLVTGPTGAGKTTVAKYLSSQFGYKLIQFQPYIASVKQKLMTPQDGEQLPARKAIEHFRQLLTNDKQSIYVIDGLPYTNKDLQNWINAVGAPHVINLQVQIVQQIKRCRKKAEGDLNAQINQQQTNKAKQSTEKNRVWIQNISNIAPSASVYKVLYNDPQIKSQYVLQRITRPRIYLVQKNNTYTYQNVAIKYGLGFINLNKIRLRDCEKEVKNSKKRDIILCHHGHEKKRIASQDLYWIQKNLGEIRYVSIWESQAKDYQDQPLELQRPKAPQKPKPAEGQPAQQKPPEDPPAQGGDAGKKKFDKYDYEWTKPGDYKNLSQWFFKSKTHITQITHTPQECFKNFKKVLDNINLSSENNVYQKVK